MPEDPTVRCSDKPISTYDWCDRCGAAVIEVETHIAWHRNLAEIIQYITDNAALLTSLAGPPLDLPDVDAAFLTAAISRLQAPRGGCRVSAI